MIFRKPWITDETSKKNKTPPEVKNNLMDSTELYVLWLRYSKASFQLLLILTFHTLTEIFPCI